MDWSRSYTARWRVFRVDPLTWADDGTVARVDSARIERTRGGLLESGTLSLTAEVGESIEEGYYRIALYAEQDGEAVRENVATLHCSASSGDVERGRNSAEADCRSVLFPASVRRVLSGTYAPKGCDGAWWAAGLLRECLSAPVEVEGSFSIDEHVVIDLGATYLEAVWDVLESGGFCLQVDGTGTVHVGPLPDVPAIDLGRAGARLLMPKVSHALDLSGVPNRYVARSGGRTAVALNEERESPTSMVARGYVHDEYDDSPRLVNGETLGAYARRRLQELSTVEDERSYEREWWPNVYPYSVARWVLPQAGMVGDLRVTRQSLDLGHGIVVTEQAAREVVTWRA